MPFGLGTEYLSVSEECSFHCPEVTEPFDIPNAKEETEEAADRERMFSDPNDGQTWKPEQSVTCIRSLLGSDSSVNALIPAPMWAPLSLVPAELSALEGQHGAGIIAMPSMAEALASARNLLSLLIPESQTVQEFGGGGAAGGREHVATAYYLVPGPSVPFKGKRAMLAQSLSSPPWHWSPAPVGATPPWSSCRDSSSNNFK